MTPQIPGLSREVHFVLPNGQHRTAKVINSNPDRPEAPTLKVELDPFEDHLTPKDILQMVGDVQITPAGMHVRNVPYDETGRASPSWHWPERT